MSEERAVYLPGQICETDVTIPGKITAMAWTPPVDISYEHWERCIEFLGALHQASRFWLGDGIEFGQHKYGEKYTQAIELTGLSESRLKVIAYTCRQVPKFRRRNLPFDLHTEVASLSPDDQDYWLDWAERNRATRDELRAELRHRRLITSRPVDEVALDNHYLEARVKNLERDLETARAQADSLQATAGVCPACGGRMACEGCGHGLD